MSLKSPIRWTLLVFLAFGCSESRSTPDAVGTVAQAVVSECGSTGLPDCPLQAWMKDSARAYMNARDFDRLALALDKLAARAPHGYDGWQDSAERAASAARDHDLSAVKQQCKACHDALRSRFRDEMRGASLF